MNLIRLDKVDSTNAAARRAVLDGTIGARGAVIAREQTAGRGTGERTWVSPRDAGIYLSIVDTGARGALAVTTEYTQLAAAACVEALRETAGLDVSIKPVNDLMIEGRKLGGILTEAIIEEGRLVTLIIGIGINWKNVPRSLPPDVPPAISVEEVLGRERFAMLLIDEVVEALIRHVFAGCEQTRKRGNAETRKEEA